MRKPASSKTAPRFWRDRLWRDRRGVAAVEFALTLPVLLTLYIGGYEAGQAVASYRKMVSTTSEIANITSLYTTMSQANDIPMVMGAAVQTMAPYSTTGMTIVISEITTDATGNSATVTWSVPSAGASALVKGSSYTLPAGLGNPSMSYILVQTTYTYTPPIVAPDGTFPWGGAVIPMHSQVYILPRLSNSITLTS